MAAIFVQGLTYAHLLSPTDPSSGTIALRDVNLSLPKGSRAILVGANGAGKSTLLQILAGKRMTKGCQVAILGKDVFRNTPPGVTFLGTEWAMNPVVRSDLSVSHFLDSVGGYRHPERRDTLLRILDVDLAWRMHRISDGERRRVQLVMGLMIPWDVLLLDEVTVDLDVLVRDHLLAFLKGESETRGATVLYATHIFDGLNAFPTHVAHMSDGEFLGDPMAWPPSDGEKQASGVGSSLHALALKWLTEDRARRVEREKQGLQPATRGPQAVPSDSEAFFKKYDYGH